MPLDGIGLFENETLVKLAQVERLLANEDQWCKGRQRDRKGRRCLIGAMADVDARGELTFPIMRAVREISGRHYWRIASFNDDPATTHQDVLRVLHRARQIIISDITRSLEPQPWGRRLLAALGAWFRTVGAAGARVYGADIASNPVPVLVSRGTDCREAEARPHRAAHEPNEMCW